MLDWNHDGKIDYKDHAFYNNVVEPGMKKDSFSCSSGSPPSNVSPLIYGLSKSFKIFSIVYVFFGFAVSLLIAFLVSKLKIAAGRLIRKKD